MTDSNLVIYGDKALLIEEEVLREVHLTDYLNSLDKVSPRTRSKTSRLPSHCIGYHCDDSLQNQEQNQISTLIYMPAGKRLLKYKERRTGENERNDNVRAQQGIVLLPDLIFKIVLLTSKASNIVHTHLHLSAYAKISPGSLNGDTSFKRAQLPNVHPTSEICFGNIRCNTHGKSIFYATEEVINSFLTSEGNDDYEDCLQGYATFKEWVDETSNVSKLLMLDKLASARSSRPLYTFRDIAGVMYNPSQ